MKIIRSVVTIVNLSIGVLVRICKLLLIANWEFMWEGVRYYVCPVTLSLIVFGVTIDMLGILVYPLPKFYQGVQQ